MHLLGLLPIPPKRKEDPAAVRIDKQEISDAILQECLRRIFAPLCSRKLAERGIIVECADGAERHCFPIVCGWLADMVEKTKILGLMSHACHSCETPEALYGQYPPNGVRPPPRDHRSYQKAAQVLDNMDAVPRAKALEAQKRLNAARIRHTPIALWDFNPMTPLSSLFKPDILHTLYLGMMKSLMEWVIGFLKKYGLLDAFDLAFRNTPRYPEYYPLRRKYTAVQQWQGKEMRSMGRIFHVVFAKTIFHSEGRNMPVDQARTAYKCSGALVDFILMAQYKSHSLGAPSDPYSLGSLDWMEYYLKVFHVYKYVFAEFRASAAKKRKIKQTLSEGRDNHAGSDVEEADVRGDTYLTL